MSTDTDLYVAADLDPQIDEIMISDAMGITVDDVRHADHIEIMHERELAPGTTRLREMHWAMHQNGFDDHDHTWERA